MKRFQVMIESTDGIDELKDFIQAGNENGFRNCKVIYWKIIEDKEDKIKEGLNEM